jgi:hypothetical protein
MRKLGLFFCLLLLTVMSIMAQEGTSAFIRAGHFSADAGTVDIFVNGESTLTGVEFSNLSDWMVVEAGEYTIAIAPEGGSATDAVLEQNFTLNAGDWVTVAVIGTVAGDSLAFQPIVENLDSLPEGLSRIGLFHGVDGLPPVTITDETGRDLVVGLGYPGTFEGSDGYTSVNTEPGERTLTITDEDGTELDEVGPTVVGTGRYYFYAAIGTADVSAFIFDITDIAAIAGDDASAEATTAETGTGNLYMRAGHFVSDAPAEVDIYLNGNLAVSNLGYTAITDFIGLAGGVYEVALVPTGGALEEAIFTDEIALFENSLTLVAAIGVVEDGSLDIVAVKEDGTTTGVGEGRIGFFQSIPTDALFNLTLDDNMLVQGVSYPDAFAGAGDGYVSVDIVAAAYDFAIEAPDAAIELDAGSITMGAGRYYLFVAVGTVSAPNYLLIPTGIPQ